MVAFHTAIEYWNTSVLANLIVLSPNRLSSHSRMPCCYCHHCPESFTARRAQSLCKYPLPIYYAYARMCPFPNNAFHIEWTLQFMGVMQALGAMSNTSSQPYFLHLYISWTGTSPNYISRRPHEEEKAIDRIQRGMIRILLKATMTSSMRRLDSQDCRIQMPE